MQLHQRQNNANFGFVNQTDKHGRNWGETFLEHYHKYYSHVVGKDEGAVFLGFGFVLAQSQAAAGMLLRQSLAKTPKILAPHGYGISSNAPAYTSEFF
jgi:hypothetical protein